MTKKLFNPITFNAANHFRSDSDQYKAKRLIHLIEAQRVFCKHRHESFTPLHAQLLRRQLGRYIHVLRTLIDDGIVETDNQYIVGEKCKGYRLAEPDQPFHCVGTYNSSPVRLSLPVHRWLFAWLKKAEVVGDHTCFALQEWQDKQFRYHPDQYMRCHTNFTNLKTELRPCLRLNGEILVSFDIVSSQPFFLLLSFFLHELNLLNLTHTQSLPLPPLHYDAPAFLNVDSDVAIYMSIVTGNADEDIYEYVAHPEQSRYEAKEEFYIKTLFGRGTSAEFKELFPTMAKFIKKVKHKDYRQLSHLLQRTEARFVIHTVAEHIRTHAPDLPLLTIHDSFVTTESREGDLLKILTEQFNALPFSPVLKRELFAK